MKTTESCHVGPNEGVNCPHVMPLCTPALEGEESRFGIWSEWAALEKVHKRTHQLAYSDPRKTGKGSAADFPPLVLSFRKEQDVPREGLPPFIEPYCDLWWGGGSINLG